MGRERKKNEGRKERLTQNVARKETSDEKTEHQESEK